MTFQKTQEIRFVFEHNFKKNIKKNTSTKLPKYTSKSTPKKENTKIQPADGLSAPNDVRMEWGNCQ